MAARTLPLDLRVWEMGSPGLVRITLVLFFLACTPVPPKPPEDAGMMCDAVAPTECNDAGLTYAADVKPIIDAHCVPCHYGQIGGPWPLTSYNDVADWQDTVRDDLVRCTMPPADAGTVMSTAEKQKVLDWLRCGYPR
jgi:hypothetical protein